MQACIKQIEILEGEGRPCCAATTIALERSQPSTTCEPDYTGLLGASNLTREQQRQKA